MLLPPRYSILRKSQSQPNWNHQLLPKLLKALCTLSLTVVFLVSIHDPDALFSKNAFLSTALFSVAHQHPIYMFLSCISEWALWDRDHLFITVPRAAMSTFANTLLTACSYKKELQLWQYIIRLLRHGVLPHLSQVFFRNLKWYRGITVLKSKKLSVGNTTHNP